MRSEGGLEGMLPSAYLGPADAEAAAEPLVETAEEPVPAAPARPLEPEPTPEPSVSQISRYVRAAIADFDVFYDARASRLIQYAFGSWCTLALSLSLSSIFFQG